MMVADPIQTFARTAIQDPNPVREFGILLERYVPDFFWTHKEMLWLWRWCSEYAKTGDVIDEFRRFCMVACKEKAMRQLPVGDERALWRTILETEHLPEQHSTFLDFFEHTKMSAAEARDYLNSLETRVKAVMQAIEREVLRLVDHSRPAAQLANEARITIESIFIAAIDLGRRVLKRAA